MRAIVTGATGCVGRNLVNALLKESWELKILHRKSSDLTKLAGLNLQYSAVDLEDKEALRHVIEPGFDAVFHVAADVSHWSFTRDRQWRFNVTGTKNLAEISLERGVKRFILTSTGAAARADIPTRIHSGYVHSKKQAEEEVKAVIAKGLDGVILRLPIVVGKYDYNNYSRIFTELKRGRFPAFSGSLIFAHAENIAKAHIQAFHNAEPGELIWLGGEKATWHDVFSRIFALIGTRPPLKPIPLNILYPVAQLMNWLSYLTRKEPKITPELVFLVSAKDSDPDVRGFIDGEPAAKRIGYRSDSIDKALRDCYDWLIEEKRL